MIGLEAIREIGQGLERPECVVAHASGLLLAADWRGAGGVAVVAPSGAVTRITARTRSVRPNGIALEPGGTVLVAHLGEDEGGVLRLHPGGEVEPVLLEVAGEALPPTNFVAPDPEGRRLYVSVSTRLRPRDRAWRPGEGDGFVALLDRGRARLVAEGLGYANECHVSPDGAWLYVNETFARRLSRLPRRADGSLGARETVAAFGPGTFPDGLAFDAEGGVWVTSIVSNRVIRVGPDGHREIVLQDADPARLDAVEHAFQARRLGRPHLDAAAGRRLASVSSLAFGGAGLRTAHLGCLLGRSIATFEAPVAGWPPLHWDAPLGPLAALAPPQGQPA